VTPILEFESTVQLKSPPTAAGSRILGTLERAGRTLGFNVLVTCGTEDHPPEDPHTLGEAFDVRTLNFTPAEIVTLLHWLQAELGEAFYCQYETPTAPRSAILAALAVVNPAATGEHLHVQRAKGTVYPPAP
jgi:hypothetical protein